MLTYTRKIAYYFSAQFIRNDYSVRPLHRCVIAVFGGVLVFSISFRIFCWYRVFVIGLSQISFFLCYVPRGMSAFKGDARGLYN